MSEYTKGPWRVGKPGPNGGHTIGTPEGLMVAMISHSVNYADQVTTAKANARLIAAAPELLEALQTLVDDCIHASGSMDYNYGEFDLKAAEAAILKAKGGQE